MTGSLIGLKAEMMEAFAGSSGKGLASKAVADQLPALAGTFKLRRAGVFSHTLSSACQPCITGVSIEVNAQGIGVLRGGR